MMRQPEKNKRPGICYAVAPGGLELPVVDVTHPAFTLNVDQAEQQRLVEKFARDGVPLSGLPAPLRRVVLRFLLRGSVLASGIQKAQGGFMSGLHTYLLKLGPDMLGSAYANGVDRKIAGSLPSLGVRLRLQDMAQLMAEVLRARLGAEPDRPLVLLNIAGGPAVDSLNALLVLNKRDDRILWNRGISIIVLDKDEEGPAFGQAALAALSEASGPLHGVRIDFQHRFYDWARADELRVRLKEAEQQGALAVCSSEGGLFEYGSDEEILENLKVLRACSCVAAVVGSVTPADDLTHRLRQTGGAATRPRGLTVFKELVGSIGWSVSRAVERPFSDQVVLV